MTDCIFCKIINGELPSSKVYEDDEVLAFLNINAVNEGHTLVIPKEHFETIYEIPDKIIGNLMVQVKNLAEVTKLALNADGINILMNNEKGAGQVIPHAHFHIIPRYKKDGVQAWQEKHKFTDKERAATADKIKAMMGGPKKRPSLLD